MKTRLALVLGDDEALRVYRDLGTRAVAAAAHGDWQAIVAYTPDDAEAETRRWLGENMRYEQQGSGDLGERLARSIRAAVGAGAERVIAIGTDCPELTSSGLEAGFAALDAADVVVGPATDGGYYLIGVRADHPTLFLDMTWSAPDTLALTLERAAEAGLSVRLLSPLSDIDTVEDLRAWLARSSESRNAGA